MLTVTVVGAAGTATASAQVAGEAATPAPAEAPATAPIGPAEQQAQVEQVREAEAAGAVDELFAVVKEADGDLAIVHGEDAVDATYDAAADRGTDLVVSVGTEQPVRALGNDPLRWQQWALDKTSFERTWPTSTGGVIVAVVDTGVRGNHEDLAGAVVAGRDFVDGGDGRIDPNGHGSHVAGIIAARANNGRGIAGGAPAARIMPIRVLNAQGSGVSSNVAAGIIWAADHGARVINLSLGGGPDDGTLTAIRYALAKGALVIAASGNSSGPLIYPAGYREAVAVGAVDSSLNRAGFSNYGAELDLVAPGDGITSLWGTGPSAYMGASGTSMATPYVAAAAALVIAAKPSLKPAQVRALLEASADDLGAPGHDAYFGHGLVDPRGAVDRALLPTGGSEGRGYWVVDRDGQVHAFGGAPSYGQPAGLPGLRPIVASAALPNGRGYWLVSENGAVYAYGDAPALGGVNHLPLNKPIVGMAATATGRGYFLLAQDGGVFAFGDAKFRGSTGGLRLNAPVLDLTLSPNGGYWFVAADGGIFSYGGAGFYGSTASLSLSAPVMSMTAKKQGDGYWLVGLDGGVFSFGRAPFHGSLPSLRASGISDLPSTRRMRALPSGNGYYMLGTNGAVFAFGNAKFHGSALGDAVDLMLFS